MWLVCLILLVAVLIFVHHPYLRILMASFFAVMLMAEVTRTRYSPVVPDYHGTNVILLGGLIIGVLVTAGAMDLVLRTRRRVAG